MNLILITSLLNPINRPLSYTKTRSVYSIEERFSQTLITIQSVKHNIPNCHIVLVEASQNIEQYDDKFKKIVNEYYNFKDNKDITIAVESPHKGLGEINMILGYILNNDISKFNSLIKISGRYYLNDTFDYQYFTNNNIFRSYDKFKVVSTRLYRINNDYFTEFIENLKKSITHLQSGKSVEHIFYLLMKYTHINHLGLSGNVAVSGDIINE